MLTVFGGLGALLYLCAWIVVPDKAEGVSIPESFGRQRRP
jgi:phage shock protein PspC (stress-responsive transcriptional regulator)